MEYLLFLAFILVLVTLVGHGIWVLCSKILGRRNPRPMRGKPPLDTLNKEELETTARQVLDLYHFMAIDKQTYTQVQEAVQEALQRIKNQETFEKIEVKKPVTPPPLPKAELAPEEPRPAPKPKAKPKPRRSMNEIFAAFVEERNIRWGELVGGMLIIFCSFALVISQWKQITSNEIGKLAMFVGVNTILFGVGLFMYKRLALVTSGKGLLIVSSLLCPLNFLAIAAMTEGPSASDLVALCGEMGALALFVVLLFFSSRMICPIWSWLITLGVMAPSGLQLLIRRLDTPHPWVGFLSLLVYGLVMGIALNHARKWKFWGKIKTNALFLLLGLSSFAAIIAFGFLFYKTGISGLSEKNLAILFSLHGMPAMACGVLLFKRKSLFGAAMAVLGGLILAGGLGLAWPESRLLISNALICFVFLTLSAILFKTSFLNLPAGLCLCLGYLFAYYEIFGSIDYSASLCYFSGALFLVSELLNRFKRDQHGFYYLILFIGASCVSFGFALIQGYGGVEDNTSTWIFGFYTLVSFGLAYRHTSSILTWVGSLASLVFITHLAAFRLESVAYPWQIALLCHAGFTTLLAANLVFNRKAMVKPLCFSALFVSAGALLMILIVPTHTLGWRTLGMALVWGCNSFILRSSLCFTLSQAVACFSILQFCDSWAISNSLRFQTPHIQMAGFSLSLVGAAWFLIQKWRNRPEILRENPSWKLLQKGLNILLLVFLIFFAGHWLFPLIQAPQGALLSWLWLGALGLTLMHHPLMRLFLIFAACLLFSGQADKSESMLRWTLTAYWCGGVAYWIFVKRLNNVLILLTALPVTLLSLKLEVSAAPLFFICLGFVGLSIREKEIKWAFAASFLLNLAVSLCVLTTLNLSHLEIIRLIQINVIASAAFGLLWRYLLPLNSQALKIQIMIPRILSGILIFFSLWWLVLNPGSMDPRILETSSFLGWISILLFLWAAFEKKSAWMAEACFAFSAYLGFTLSRWGCGYQALMAAMVVFAWVLFFVPKNRFAPLFCFVAATLAVRTALMDPWWSSSIFIGAACLVNALACRMKNYSLLFLSGALFSAAASLGWWELAAEHHLKDLIHVIAITLSLTGLAGFFLEPEKLYHRFTVVVSILVSFAAVVFDLYLMRGGLYPVFGWIAAVLVTGVGSHRFRKTGLYLLGLIAMGLWVIHMDPAQHIIIWTLTLLCAGYVFLASLIVRDLPINHLVTCVLAIPAFYLACEYPEGRWLRLAVVSALYPSIISMGILGKLRTQCLTLGWVLAVAWAWCWATPGCDILQRIVLLLTALVFSLFIYGIGILRLCKQDSPWSDSVKTILPHLGVGVAISVFLAMGFEIYSFLALGKVELAPFAIALVALTLLSLCVFMTMFAVTKKVTQAWLVYGAEVVLALLFVHIRICMPYLFHGFFTQYWPIIVIVIAFVGVGLSEFFSRRGWDMLSDPVGKTGIFLPLLPVIGYWARNTIPGAESSVHYSAQLFLAGLFYGVMSIRRGSFLFGMLGALIANGGLWFYLHSQEGFGFFDHPQLWLVPLAVTILIAAQINQKHLAPSQLSIIRYMCLMTAYISSTMDIFIAGVAHSPWLPLALMVLSVIGVLLGMLIRVRAYLFLGSGFLLLSLISMVWHATARYQWTWLWWISGIGLGLGIFFLFAVFEKKRDKILAVVNDLKQWEG